MMIRVEQHDVSLEKEENHSKLVWFSRIEYCLAQRLLGAHGVELLMPRSGAGDDRILVELNATQSEIISNHLGSEP